MQFVHTIAYCIAFIAYCIAYCILPIIACYCCWIAIGLLLHCCRVIQSGAAVLLTAVLFRVGHLRYCKRFAQCRQQPPSRP